MVQSNASDYLQRGWVPIPIPFATKAPVIREWQKLRVTAETIGQYFNGARQNIGILLGEPSSGLVDIDLDCIEAVIAARHLLPDTGCVFGRSGNPASHLLFFASCKTRKFADAAGDMLVELRSTGCQTLMPPSVHPSGEIIGWVADNGPAEIEGDRLTRIVGLVAAAALIARHWPTHGRHDAALALGGALRRAGWTLEKATLFMRAVADAGRDEEAADRVRAVDDTFGREGAATGWPRLGDLLGRDVVGRVREWLGMQGPADERTPEGVDPDPTNEDRTEPGLTDLGNAHRFARDHGADVRYCWPWGRWLVWNGRYWCRDQTGEIHRLAEATVRGIYEEAAQSLSKERREALGKWAVKCEAHERRIKMLASAQAIAGIPIQPEDMDRDPWLLNVRSGTIDLRSGNLRPHAREDYITRCLDVDYDPEAACPTWERFIHEVFRGNAEIIAFVQRAIGYSLTGAIIEHVLIVLYGLGSNGKTTLIDALHYLLGPSYAKHAPTDLLLARRGEHHPTELATLHGARLVTATETGEGRRLAESLVKQLTGGDPVTARRMREDFWQFRPEFKLWLATNHKPQIRGTDHAIWRRIRLIPFDVTFHAPETGKAPQQDPTLPARLREETTGILAWAVRGCLAWQCEGLGAPDAVRDATEAYRAEMDVFAMFFEERCVFDESAEARASDLYRSYTAWCEAAGERIESQRSFGRRLTEKGCERYRNNGIWYLGVRLRATNEAADGTKQNDGTKRNLSLA